MLQQPTAMLREKIKTSTSIQELKGQIKAIKTKQYVLSNVDNHDSMSQATLTAKKASLKRKKFEFLASSFQLETELMEFWYPLEFSRSLDKNVLVPLDLFDKSWVLFRDIKKKTIMYQGFMCT